MNSFSLCARCFLVVVLCIAGTSCFTVSGNTIKDPNGKTVLLRGVDRPSFEWSAVGQYASASDYQLMAGWGANVVRIATNQDFWLASGSAGPAYSAQIDQQISWARAAGLAVILDLHWNNGGQQMMADRNSITYWSQVAARYKSNPWVMFELYNEPHDIPWSVWLSGSSQWAGMQQLYNAVRGAGANNTVICGGLNWAFDLSNVTSNLVQGVNIAYATHPYDYAGKQQANWDAAFGNLAGKHPVIMTEFGQYCNNDNYVSTLLSYAQSKSLHWTAWAWWAADCNFPSIISDWSGTPSAGVGVLVKQYLSGAAPAPPASGTTTGSSTSGSSAPVTPSPASGALLVYASGVQSGWSDWSWSTSYSLSDTSRSFSGTTSIRFQVTGYQGVYLHYDSEFESGSYSAIQFYVNGGAAAVPAADLGVQLYGPGTSPAIAGSAVAFPVSVVANQWTLVSIPISSFGAGASTQITGFAIVSTVSNSAGTIYIDEISFVPTGALSTPAPTQAPTQPATPAPTAAPPTAAPTLPPTAAPTLPPTAAPTHAATVPPTATPTQPATLLPTAAPTQPATLPPTAAPTHAATAAPTAAPTPAATQAPTAAPTHAATQAPATTAPTQPATLPPTAAPTNPPSSGCTASSIVLTQVATVSWVSGSQTYTQYSLQISTTCPQKTLTSLTLEATNWTPFAFWNINVASSSANGDAILELPSYLAVGAGENFQVGYQTTGPEVCLSVSTFTFQ